MKNETVSGLGVALALALIAGAVASALLLGAERLMTLFVVFVAGILVIGVICAAALVVRAWKKDDSPPVVEKHVYHEGRQQIVRERVLDGRTQAAPEVRLLQAPGQGQFVTADMLRAAFLAGQQGSGSGQAPQAEQEQPETIEWDAGSVEWKWG